MAISNVSLIDQAIEALQGSADQLTAAEKTISEQAVALAAADQKIAAWTQVALQLQRSLSEGEADRLRERGVLLMRIDVLERAARNATDMMEQLILSNQLLKTELARRETLPPAQGRKKKRKVTPQ